MRTLSTITPASNILKSSDMSTSMDQPSSTAKGTTKSATWVEDPTAMPMARSILFFIAAVTAVVCSTAFPTKGRMITPMKVCGMPECRLYSSISPTRNSELAMDAARTTTRSAKDMKQFNSGSSSGSSSPTNMCTWVFSWKTKKSRYMNVSKMAAIRDTCSTSSLEPPLARNSGGSTSEMELRSRHETFDVAPFRLKPCSEYLNPPRRKAVPSTSRRFEITDPRSDPCTTGTRFFLRADQVTMTSTAFPKVALTSPPISSPV
mmetsp:Transcript_43531/g.123186  ORF Transcript_43531/g.123186 Transcript_43531/m.123186 type:complete len:262 (+) Transcript_43531:393-1178(+)